MLVSNTSPSNSLIDTNNWIAKALRPLPVIANGSQRFSEYPVDTEVVYDSQDEIPITREAAGARKVPSFFKQPSVKHGKLPVTSRGIIPGGFGIRKANRFLDAAIPNDATNDARAT